jgi:hypothetical protein
VEPRELSNGNARNVEQLHSGQILATMTNINGGQQCHDRG